MEMDAVTAMCPLRASFIPSGKLLRRDVGGPRSCARYRRGERGARGAAVALHVSWAGRTLWAHDASHASIATSVPIMGPGATVGPVGTRVPMDLSSASPVRWVEEILRSPRRDARGETARKESSRSIEYGRMPEETGLTAFSSMKMPSSTRKTTQIPLEALLAS